MTRLDEPERVDEPRATTHKLGRKEYLGYAAGDAANNLAFSMAGMFLLVYYTDVVGLAAGAVGTLFLVVRAFDAFADIFAGRMVDRTQTRWGKFRPFILFGSLPLLLLTVALFSVPDMSDGASLVYAYATYALFGLTYSLVNIPYGSLATAMTQDPDERAKLASFRVTGTNLAILLLVLIVSPQIEGSSDLQRSLTITTSLLVVVGMALYLFTFFTAKEQVRRKEAKPSLRDVASTLKQNGPLLRLCLSSLLALTGLFCLQTVGTYYAREVLGNATYFTAIIAVQTGGALVAAAIVPWLASRFGKKVGYIAFAAVAVVGGVGVALVPASNAAVPIAFFGVLGLGVGVVTTLMWALEADTVEYGEWTTGTRTEGASYSVFSFTRKLSQAMGGAAAAWTIGIGGYVAGADVQSSEALDAIKFAAGGVPAIFFVLGAVIMLRYPLSEARFQEIVGDIAEHRDAG